MKAIIPSFSPEATLADTSTRKKSAMSRVVVLMRSPASARTTSRIIMIRAATLARARARDRVARLCRAT
jgi:hypothetical protein